MREMEVRVAMNGFRTLDGVGRVKCASQVAEERAKSNGEDHRRPMWQRYPDIQGYER